MVERIEHGDAERAAKKKSGGKKENNAQASKLRKQGELATETATQRQDDEVCCENC